MYTGCSRCGERYVSPVGCACIYVEATCAGGHRYRLWAGTKREPREPKLPDHCEECHAAWKRATFPVKLP